MATRFYFSINAAPCSPAYDAEWDKTTNSVRRFLSRTKLSTIQAYSSDLEVSASAPYDILNRQMISEPLRAQTITGTVKGQARFSQDAADGDYCRALVIKVVSNDGSTVRGTLLSHFPGSLTSEFATSLTNRNFPPSTAVTDVEAQEGDRLVVEIGARAFNTLTDSKQYTFRLQDSSAVSDLPEDETTTDDLCPWIEFSQDLQFQGPQQIYQNIAQVEYSEPPALQISQNLVQLEYEADTSIYISGDIPLALVPTSSVELELALAGAVTVSLGVTSSVEVTTEFVGDIPITLGVSSLIVPPDVLVTGDIPVSLGVSSAILPPDEVVAGAVEVSLLPSAAIELSAIEVAGAVPVALSVSSEVDIVDVELDVTGGLVLWGPGDWGRLEIEVVEPEVYEVELEGGVVLGDSLEYEFEVAGTYEYVLSGGVAVGGEPTYSFFDPSTLTPVEHTLSCGIAIGGAFTYEHVGPDALTTSLILTGGVVVGEIRLAPVETTAPTDSEAEILTLTLRGGVAVGGSPEYVLDEPETYEHTPRFGGLRVGGALIFSTFVPPSFALELAGGVSIGGTVFDDEELVETWALSGFAFSPSLYSCFPFNSYCEHRNQAFAAGADGVYLLEGADDNGEEFFTGLRIGPTNFGADNLKRLRGVYPGVAGTPELRVKGEQTQQEGFYELSRRERFDCGREVQDRVMTLDLHNFDELSHLEIIPLVMMRR